MPAGWVYILSNEAFPHLLKVGKTTTSPSVRAAELNGTGVPHDYRVAYAALSPDIDRHEAEAHRRLSAHRESQRREFFRIDLETARQTVAEICGAADAALVVALKVDLEIALAESKRLRALVDELRPWRDQGMKIRERAKGLHEEVAHLRAREAEQTQAIADLEARLEIFARSLTEAQAKSADMHRRANRYEKEAFTLRALLADSVRSHTPDVAAG